VSETIHTNKKHLFLTVEAGFVAVANLVVGIHIVKADGTAGMVTAWKVVPGVSVMYNLEVANDHTFTAGDGQWVVHNDMACGIHSSLPYNRDAFGETPNEFARQTTLARDPECVYCEVSTPSTDADHVPSLIMYHHLKNDGKVENMII
jgi:hypothetical protein